MTPIGRVLLTGANGFIGSHLAEALVARGYRVRCLVRRTSDLAFIRDLPVEWAHGALDRPDSLADACSDLDAVCHCAALTRALDEQTFQRVNTQGTEALARACLQGSPRLRRFLFVSSQAAAGPSCGPDDILDETRPPAPITWYGKSKLAAEQALLTMGDRLPLTIVRPAAVYGPRDRDFHLYFKLVHRRLSLRLGRSERRISAIYIHDLVSLVLRALESDRALGRTYFAVGHSYGYGDLSGAIAAALGRRPLTVTLPVAVLTPISVWSKLQGSLTGKPALLNDQRVLDMRQRFWLCSGDRARAELEFRPAYDMEAAVRETAAWYLSNGWL